MNELVALVLGGGLFTFLGVVVTLMFTRKKSQAEIGKARAETKKLEEEAEKINIENENMRVEQKNSLVKQNLELEKAREELKAKLYIANEQNLLLSQELQHYRVELSENQKKFEALLTSQHKDIVEIKKVQTGQLPNQLPGAMEHKK